MVDGEVPAARGWALSARPPSLTRGEGVLETSFDHYQKVRGEPPRRRPAHASERLLYAASWRDTHVATAVSRRERTCT